MKKILPTVYCVIFFVSAQAQGPNSWEEKQPLGISAMAREGAAGFSIGNKGYIGTGIHSDGLNQVLTKDFWEYDPIIDTWTQKADFGGTARFNAIGVSIGAKGYMGTGNDGNSNFRNDFWEYDPSTNSWTQKTNLGGAVRWGAASFCIGDKGYISTGGYTNDLWEYDPATDSWTQKANFGGTARTGAVGFSIGNKGYIGTGFDPTYTNDFWEYNPINDIWTEKASFGGSSRTFAIGFGIGSKGYLGLGFNDIKVEKDFWEYDAVNNSWTQKADFLGEPRVRASGFSIGTYGYIGFGSGDVGYNDWWRYTPVNILPLQLISFTVGHKGKTNELFWSTAQEINSSHFEIERSSNSILFTKIGTTNVTGSNLQTIYTFTDVEPIKSINYYRLKMIDKDGSFTYSDIRRISNKPGFGVSITSNPVNTGYVNLNINTEKSAAIFITITNLNGKVLYTRQLAATSGYLNKTINVTAFAKGVYVLKAVSGDDVKTLKFVIE